MSTQILNQISEAAFQDEMQKLANKLSIDLTGGVAHRLLNMASRGAGAVSESAKYIPYAVGATALTVPRAAAAIGSARNLSKIQKKNWLKRFFLEPSYYMEHKGNMGLLGAQSGLALKNLSKTVPAGLAGVGAIGLMNALKKKD